MKNKYLTKAERAQLVLTGELRDILIGLLLGDIYAQKLATNVNFILVRTPSTRLKQQSC